MHVPVTPSPARRPPTGRLRRFLTISLLAACGVNMLTACMTLAPRMNTAAQPETIHPSKPAKPVKRHPVGHARPDGGASFADRGIGGTGAPVVISPLDQTSDRGIGGTGIIGVVTGFGSIFVDGMEIRLDDPAAIDIDGNTAPASSLRAGQMVAIQAEGPANAPLATTVSVRSMVTGRIDAIEVGSATLVIAGQTVSVAEATWGGNRFVVGDSVRVSGLRRADGTIVASRLDAAPAGTFLARGRVERDGDIARVGKLVLSSPDAAELRDGEAVLVSGDYAFGAGHIDSVVPDILFSSPADYFGSATSHLVVQAMVRVDGGVITMNGTALHAKPSVAAQATHDGIAIVSLERGPDGSYTAVDLRYADFRGQAGSAPQVQNGADAVSWAAQRNAHASWRPEAGTCGPAARGRIATASIEEVCIAAASAPGDPFVLNGSSRWAASDALSRLPANKAVPDSGTQATAGGGTPAEQ
jgi:hypothetical protein